MDETLQKIIRDILLAYDDGVRACVGTMSNGDLVWKGSFIAFMERLRDTLPDAS
jgi:hypothetical protein